MIVVVNAKGLGQVDRLSSASICVYKPLRLLRRVRKCSPNMQPLAIHKQECM